MYGFFINIANRDFIPVFSSLISPEIILSTIAISGGSSTIMDTSDPEFTALDLSFFSG